MLVEYVEFGSYTSCREGAGGSLKDGALSGRASADPVNQWHSFKTKGAEIV